eukprot:11168912-Lingulodinium_polyedra.AAC.1
MAWASPVAPSRARAASRARPVGQAGQEVRMCFGQLPPGDPCASLSQVQKREALNHPCAVSNEH